MALHKFRSRRVVDQLFGLDLSPHDFLRDIMDRPTFYGLRSRYSRPWRKMALGARDVTYTINTDEDKFRVNVDFQHFAVEEISVTYDEVEGEGFIIIEGDHEKKDEYGIYISRQFMRRYPLPEGCHPDTIKCGLSHEGVLTVVAPRKSENSGEGAAPITQTVPVRRKSEEEDGVLEKAAEENGEIGEEEKSPQKKRRC